MGFGLDSPVYIQFGPVPSGSASGPINVVPTPVTGCCGNSSFLSRAGRPRVEFSAIECYDAIGHIDAYEDKP